MRRFESSRPSQSFQHAGSVARGRAPGPRTGVLRVAPCRHHLARAQSRNRARVSGGLYCAPHLLRGSISMSEAHTTLVYDGDCGICRYWVSYWQRQTNDNVVYRPYQEAAADFPGIPVDDFRHAIKLVEPGGKIYSGAAATYRVLRFVPGRGVWWWLYERVPGFAPASERAYAFFARRRELLARLTRLMWGPA